MPTSPDLTLPQSLGRTPVRLRLIEDPAPGELAGVWWPQSRDLQTEAADLVDHFPSSAGRVERLLFSRPDWDASVTAEGGGVRSIVAARGRVKVGSFPQDDTHLMIVTVRGGRRLKLHVIPSDIARAEGERLLRGADEVVARSKGAPVGQRRTDEIS